jgi:quaternary ammonium compound-resistance protein SugE
MPWLLLVLAGLLEVVWASSLKRAGEPLWLGVTVVALTASMVLLGLAVRSIPISVGYAIWVGIGAVGTAIVGVLVYGEKLSAAQMVFLGLITIGIVGMRLTHAPAAPAE